MDGAFSDRGFDPLGPLMNAMYLIKRHMASLSHCGGRRMMLQMWTVQAEKF